MVEECVEEWEQRVAGEESTLHCSLSRFAECCWVLSLEDRETISEKNNCDKINDRKYSTTLTKNSNIVLSFVLNIDKCERNNQNAVEFKGWLKSRGTSLSPIAWAGGHHSLV